MLDELARGGEPLAIDPAALAAHHPVRSVEQWLDGYSALVGPAVLQAYMEHSTERVHTGSIPGQVSVPAGTTATTTYTMRKWLPPLFGCHLPGHYAYGIRGTIRVT